VTLPAVDVVIPMAGEGSRFRDAGFMAPKPFVDVAGEPMIARVMENLALPGARYILIAQRAHLEAAKDIAARLEREHACEFVAIAQRTEGTAATLLFARHVFHRAGPILVANSDQLVDGGVLGMVTDAVTRTLDGSIMTFEDPTRNPKWSFARTDDAGMVLEVREKVAISTHATVGIYYFGSGEQFVDAATQMIICNDRTNNEFYTCPVYNHVIAAGGRVGTWNIPSTAMHGLGTPEDLAAYVAQYHPATP